MLPIEELTARELKNFIFYANDIDILVSEHCPEGYIYLLRKSHLSRRYKVGFGNDVIIVSPSDFSGCYIEK